MDTRSLFLSLIVITSANGQLKDVGQCSILSQSGFQLEVVGPFSEDNVMLVTADTADVCAELCCQTNNANNSCDVSIYTEDMSQNCLMVQCPSADLDNGPCKPYFPQDPDEIIPFVRDKKSTLMYIIKRNQQESSFNLKQLTQLFELDNGGIELISDETVPETDSELSDKPKKNPTYDLKPADENQNFLSNSVVNSLDLKTQAVTVATAQQLTNDSIGNMAPNNVSVTMQPVAIAAEQIDQTTEEVVIVSNQTDLHNLLRNQSVEVKNTTAVISPAVTPTVIQAQSTVDNSTNSTNIDAATVAPPTELPSSSTNTPPSSSQASTVSTTTLTPSSSIQQTTTTIKPTTSTTTTTTQAIRKITVTVVGNKKIQLPSNTIVLKAEVDGKPQQASGYNFEWRPIDLPNDFSGTVLGITENTYTVSGLASGQYTFKVTVTDTNALGEATVNVTVLEPTRINSHPVAIISPKHQEITLPTNSALLDGQKSTDDVKIVSYHWEPVQAPLQSVLSTGEPLGSEKVLQLKNLQVGNYTIELTVTDTDGATNSTQATIIVNKKIDNPPIANAGPNQKIEFPQNHITLCGNDSTDDWGIVAYEWSVAQESENQVVDQQGVRSKCLELSNLEVGEYTFQLTVTDEAQQSDTAKVKVIVQPESNHPPKANAGKPQTIFEPKTGETGTVTLDGSKSTDDKKVTKYNWKQLSAPKATTVTTPNKAITTVTGLDIPGQYIYELTVFDVEQETNTAQVTITVNKEEPPVAEAGPPITITLPDDVAIINGNLSTDHYGITSYHWVRDKSSPAIGRIFNHTDEQAVLVVEGLTAGVYTFHLTVTNVREKSSSTSVKVTVLDDPLISKLVELHLDKTPDSFTLSQQESLVNQLKILLSLLEGDHVIISSLYVEHSSTDLVVLFYVKLANGQLMNALQVVETLNQKFRTNIDFSVYNAKRADTYLCENTCSGHGKCHDGSKQCECDTFWMQNFFRVYSGDGTPNCDWSVLYVIIISCILLFVSCCFVYFFTCCCLRRKRKGKAGRTKRKKHGTGFDNGGYEKLSTKPSKNGSVQKNGMTRHNAQYRSSSLMRSMTSSSEDDNQTVFEKRQLLNGPTVRRHRNKPGFNKRSKHKSSTLVNISDVSDEVHSGDSFDGRGLDGGDRVALRGVGGEGTHEDIL